MLWKRGAGYTAIPKNISYVFWNHLNHSYQEKMARKIVWLTEAGSPYAPVPIQHTQPARKDGVDCGGASQLSLTPALPSSQWDLACTCKTLLQLSQSIFMAGILVGNLMSGIMADRSVMNKPGSRSKSIAPLGWTQRGDLAALRIQRGTQNWSSQAWPRLEGLQESHNCPSALPTSHLLSVPPHNTL